MAIKFTYVGHATYFLDIGHKRVLIDPFFANNPTTDISPDDVSADFILVSHGHFDHIGDAVPIAQDGEAWAKRVEAETDTKVHVLSAGDALDL